MSQKLFLNFLENIDTDTVTSNTNNKSNKLNQILDSATSDINISGNINYSVTSDINMTGGMDFSATSQSNNSNKLKKLLDSATSDINMTGGMDFSTTSQSNYKINNNISNNNMIGGNVDVDKLLSMLTTDSSSEINSVKNETSTETLENQLKQILNTNKNSYQQGGECLTCGHNIKSNDIRKFFTELKSKGVKVDVKLNNQSMTDYFDETLQTTTDINSQDGGANNKFSAAQSVRKDISKEFNIPNGKNVVKIAFAVVKAVVDKTPELANDVEALSKAVKKHFEENKSHFKRML